MEELKIVIPLPPRTKKNHSQIIMVKGRPRLIPSKQYKDYEKECGKFMPTLEKSITDKVELKCLYYMPTRRRVDLVNLLEATCDILVHYKVIEDDNNKIVYSHDGSRVYYDKDNPRVEITITKIEG